MSRTQKGSKSSGYDFGARYNCDKCYLSDHGKDPKNQADRERRNQGKRIVRKEIARDGWEGF